MQAWHWRASAAAGAWQLALQHAAGHAPPVAAPSGAQAPFLCSQWRPVLLTQLGEHHKRRLKPLCWYPKAEREQKFAGCRFLSVAEQTQQKHGIPGEMGLTREAYISTSPAAVIKTDSWLKLTLLNHRALICAAAFQAAAPQAFQLWMRAVMQNKAQLLAFCFGYFQ